MTRTIKYFMWGFQDAFRTSLEFELNRAFEAAGIPLEGEVLLVGFLADDARRHPICIEPENGPHRPEQLEGVIEEAQRILSEEPEARVRYSDARSQVLHARGMAARSRARALENRLTEIIPESSFLGEGGDVPH